MSIVPYIGGIRMFAGNFAPRGWALCQGQLLPIASNTALFSILGTTYGGDGKTTFALPDLRGRAVVSAGFNDDPRIVNLNQGQTTGKETTKISPEQLPAHNHTGAGSFSPRINSIPGTQPSPKGRYFAGSTMELVYSQTLDNPVEMGAQSFPVIIQENGQGTFMVNIQPSIAVNYIIALEGIYPSRP